MARFLTKNDLNLIMCHYLLNHFSSMKPTVVHPITMESISLKSTRDLPVKTTNPCFFLQVQSQRPTQKSHDTDNSSNV